MAQRSNHRDALLSDLQSSSSRAFTYHHEYSPPGEVIYEEVSDRQLPTRNQELPQYEVVDYEVEPLYQTQTVRSSQVVRHSNTPQQDTHAQQMYSSVQKKPSVTKAARHIATLSSNLSELDNLLRELNSSQYLADQEPVYDAVDDRFAAKHIDSRPIQMTMSSATQELDNLMASLSDLEIQEPMNPNTDLYAKPNKGPQSQPSSSIAGNGSAPAPFPMTATSSSSTTSRSPHTTGQNLSSVPRNVVAAEQSPVTPAGKTAANVSLNALMADLDKNMTQQGLSVVPKGHCAACAKPIVGQVITALAQLWHPEHFVCVHCQEPLGSRNFFERDGMPYCEDDYHLLFSPPCALCGGPVLDKCVTAMDKTWHPEHFCCVVCKIPLGDCGFHERDGEPYCRNDYYALFAPRCGGCERPIIENFVTALNQQWHTHCFVCTDCRKPFGAASFYDHEGKPYCELHFHAIRGSLCFGCGKPVTGRCITAMYRKFHPEHFVCAYCQRQLNKGTFKENDDKPYCQPCFARLFS